MEPLDLLDNWTAFARPFRTAAHVCVLTDFDGTLAPIAPSPDAARLPLETYKLLQRLASLPRVTFGIVSGRSVADLRRQADVDRSWYVGLHGFEIRTPQGLDRRWFTRKETRRIMAIADQVEEELSSVPGVIVERKGAGASVHFRQVDRNRLREVQDAILEAWRKEGKGLRLRPGNQVLELLPTENRTKGTGVRFILGKIRSDAFPVYFGDDLTDLNAFAALRDRGVRVGVGTEISRHLDFRLKDPAGVAETLRRLAALLEGRR